MQRISEDDILLDFKEAMEFLRVSRSTIYRLMKANLLRGHKVNRKWVFYKKDLKAVLLSQAPGAPSTATGGTNGP